MGGYGSGRHRDRGARRTVFMMSIDLTLLKKRKLLVPGLTAIQSWSRDGETIGSVKFTVYQYGLCLNYKTRTGDEDWQEIDETIYFGYTDTNFGGRRRWLICPSCQRRCRIIYGGKVFRCRTCNGLTYESQYELGWQRSDSRGSKIIKRLGGDPCDGDFPGKPKGMHWRTYELWYETYKTFEHSSLVSLMQKFG